MTYAKSLWRLFRSMPVILALFVLLQVASLFAFLFVYENAREKTVGNLSYQERTCSYSLDFGQGVPYSAVSDRFRAFPDEDYRTKKIFLSEDKSLVAVVGECNHGLQLGALATRANEIVVDKITLSEKKREVGDTVSLYGREYTVSGCFYPSPDGMPFCQVSPLSIQPGDTVTAFQLCQKDYPSSRKKADFLSQLEEQFPEAAISGPQDRDLNFEYGFDYMMLISVLAVLLIFVDISFLYTFFLEKRKRTFCVYRLCGCRKSRLFFMLLGELLAVVLACVFVTVLLWAFVFRGLLFPEFKPDAARMGIPILCYLLCVLLVFVPKFKDYTDMPVVSLLRKSGG